MRKITILTILFLIIINGKYELYSQNNINPPVLSGSALDTLLNGSTVTATVNFHDQNVYNRNMTDFILGYNYGTEGRQLDKLLNSNTYLSHWETSCDYDWNHYGDYNNWYLRIRPFGVGGDINVCSSFAMYYEPAITVDTSETFTPGAENKYGALFGFRYKDPNLTPINNTVATNHLLDTTKPILSSIWPNDELRFWDKCSDETQLTNGIETGYEEGNYGKGDLRDKFNAREMYLSVNLRSISPTITKNLDVPLIKLKIKIKAKKVTSLMDSVSTYIKFDTIPGNILQDINSSLGQYRGKTRKDTTAPNPTTEFVITPRMLITSSTSTSTADQPITLSAKFNCWYPLGTDPRDANNFYNPYLKPRDERHDQIINHNYEWLIDTMDIEVWYRKAADYEVAIDWIKLETPGMQEMFRGKHDKYIHRKISYVQEMFRAQSTTHYNKIAGFYCYDEMSKNQWAPAHYFTMLMDTLSNSECNSMDKPSLIDFSTGYKSFWNGTNLINTSGQGNPFLRRGDMSGYCGENKRTTFGSTIGYAGYIGNYSVNINYSDDIIKNSKYETFLPDRDTFEINYFTTWDLQYTQAQFIYPWGKLFSYEKTIYDSYYNRKSVIFGSRPWAAWQWIPSTWQTSLSFNSIYNYDYSPLTGEELNLEAFYPLALGAKGEFYWRKVRDFNNVFNSANSIIVEANLQPSNSPTFLNKLNAIESATGLESILTHPQMYGDFFDFSSPAYDTLYRWGANYDINKYNWNLMDITQNRVYLGLNTIRTGLVRHNQWIKYNNDVLVKLKLVAWRGKGFSKFYQQDTGYVANILYNYIDSNSIKTRPLNRIQSGSPFYEQSMAHDSGFYDIMIHKQADYTMEQAFTVAVVNRRTDPLIFDSVDSKFYFISTYEFENLVEDTIGGQKANPITGVMKTTSYWRDMYWKKQGSREIRFKFNCRKPGNPNATVLLRILEMMDTTSYNNNWPWWRKDQWNNAILDTVIRSDQELVLKMAPGSVRMFDVRIKCTAPFTGELANSNQTKIIAYPAHQTGNLDYSGHDDSIYYHMVYQRKDSNNRYNTYYRRSHEAYKHNVNTKIIQWTDEVPLISSFNVYHEINPRILTNKVGIPGADSCDCKYPTLTARWDAVSGQAKIYTLSACTFKVPNDTPRVYIIENDFPTDINPLFIPSGRSTPIGFAYAANVAGGVESDRWGVPTINASKDVNYIAWNDSLYGITAVCKLPHDTGYIANPIHFKFNNNTTYKALYPSLNTFSMIPYWDDNAGLAWQETQLSASPNDTSKIYYTILKRDINGNIIKYAPKNVCDISQPLFFDRTYKPGDSNIVCISPNPPATYYTYPQVYRNVEDSLDAGGNILALGAGDRVYWQGGVNKNASSALYIKMIDLNLGLNCFNCLYPKRVYSRNSQLGQPNASQGELRMDIPRGPFNWSDSAYVVNFISYPYSSQPSYTNASIYQIDHDYWGIFNRGGTWLPLDTAFMKVDTNIASIGTGLYPHLVRSAVLKQPGDWKLNNRIYETTGQIIKTSETYFLKGEKEYKASYPMLKLVDMRTEESSMFSPFAISNDDNPQMYKYLKINSFEKKGLYYSAMDTISTAWFKIGNLKDLSFFTDGNNVKGINISLERQKDKKKFTLSVKNSKQNIMAMNKLHFINGKDDLYRIIWTKSNDSIIVTSDLLFGDRIDYEGRIDTVSSQALGKSITLDESIIDLNWDNTVENNENMNVFVCPNPANDMIYASTNLPLDLYNDRNIKSVKITYILINTLGTVITEKEGFPGDVIQFNTNELPNGMYIIKALSDIYNSNHYKNLNGYKSIIIRH